ncbi:MAG: hypothetical protein KAX49_10030 [Halanaerobiales bacterium]|nr:hypothetical protein [Halanaerobiales bacterium]
MSYCVNCGVELAKTEKNCPLCNVEVINPAEENNSANELLFPLYKKIKKQVKKDKEPNIMGGIIYSSFLSIPIFITLVLDLLISKGITWSFYPIISVLLFGIFTMLPLFVIKNNPLGIVTIDTVAVLIFLLLLDCYTDAVTWAWYFVFGIGLAWICFVLPFIVKKLGAIKIILIDGLAIALYLYFIEFYTESGPWFLSLGLPIVFVLTIIPLVIAILAYFSVLKGLAITGTIFIAIGLESVLIEMIVNLYLAHSIISGWSLIVLVANIPIAATFFILYKKVNLQVWLQKKFHI